MQTTLKYQRSMASGVISMAMKIMKAWRQQQAWRNGEKKEGTWREKSGMARINDNDEESDGNNESEKWS